MWGIQALIMHRKFTGLTCTVTLTSKPLARCDLTELIDESQDREKRFASWDIMRKKVYTLFPLRYGY